MKFLKILTTFCLAFLLFTLVGCSSFNSIKKNFEANGYTYLDKNEGMGNIIEAELNDEKIKVEVHMFKKSLNYAIVIEFKSSKDLDKYFEDSETLKGLIKDLSKSELVLDNNLLIPITLKPKEMIDIFQGKSVSK